MANIIGWDKRSSKASAVGYTSVSRFASVEPYSIKMLKEVNCCNNQDLHLQSTAELILAAGGLGFQSCVEKQKIPGHSSVPASRGKISSCSSSALLFCGYVIKIAHIELPLVHQNLHELCNIYRKLSG